MAIFTFQSTVVFMSTRFKYSGCTVEYKCNKMSKQITQMMEMNTCTYLSKLVNTFSCLSQMSFRQRRTAEHPQSPVRPELTLSTCSRRGGSAFIALLPDLVSLSLPKDFWSQSTSSPPEVRNHCLCQSPAVRWHGNPPIGWHIWVIFWT